jgi:S-DNA-T family DNA segregation ATPase FtsK/SpoIIIE
MPKAESSNPKDRDTPSFEGPRHRPHWLAAFTCLVLGVLLTVALIDYEPGQSIQNTTNPTSVNLVGVIGAEFSFWSYNLIGASTWLFPVFLFWMTYIYLRSARSFAGTRLFAMACCVVSFSPLVAM